MEKKPRILYLAYCFPPAPAIASVRAWNTATSLSNLGWDVQVVTPNPDLWIGAENIQEVEAGIVRAGIKVIRTGHGWRSLVRGQMKYPKGFIFWLAAAVVTRIADYFRIESQIGWLHAATRACSKLEAGTIDVILATGNPYVSFRLARKLSKRLKCPFVLDYRDPWNGDPHSVRPDLNADVREEAELLRSCHAVSIVSKSWAQLLHEKYGVGNKTTVVTNGYSPDMFARVEPAHFTEYAVVYAGTLYPPKRVLDPVLEAFAKASAASDRTMKFHYYGSFGSAVAVLAKRLGIEANVKIHGNVSRSEALSAQKAADVVVVVASVEPTGSLADNGVVTGKIFDCLALESTALVVAPPTSDLYPIAATCGGMVCYSGDDINGMADFFLKSASGYVPERKQVKLFQWTEIGKNLDGMLRQTVSEYKK